MRSPLGRDQEGGEVVNELFGTFGPLVKRRWRGWGGRRGAAGAVHRQGG